MNATPKVYDDHNGYCAAYQNDIKHQFKQDCLLI